MLFTFTNLLLFEAFMSWYDELLSLRESVVVILVISSYYSIFLKKTISLFSKNQNKTIKTHEFLSFIVTRRYIEIRAVLLV